MLAVGALALGLAVASSARAAAIDHGTITVGRGVAGARIDMTRAQVIAKLGAPVSTPGQVLSYEPESAAGIFDLYLAANRRVRQIILAGFTGSKAWTLADGNAIFARGAIDRLYRRYGRRVHRIHERLIDERRYVIRSRYHGRPVETRFLVDRFSRTRAQVLDVSILFTDRG